METYAGNGFTENMIKFAELRLCINGRIRGMNGGELAGHLTEMYNGFPKTVRTENSYVFL